MSLLIDGLDRCRQALAKLRLNDLESAVVACPTVDCFLLPISHLLGQEPADTWELREGWSKPRETLDTLRGYLATNPDDTSVRYVVLSVLYALAVDPDDLDEWNDGCAAERQEFRDEFAEIARLPKVEGLTEPKVVRWEIVNSCAARDFPRAERLYDRLDELQPEKRAERDALRGQFHFFQSQPGLHLGSDLLEWWPSLFKADFFTAAPSLARWGVALEEPLADPGAMR